MDRAIIWAARGVLLAACAVTAFFAFYPGPNHPALFPWDKAEHFVSFGVLMTISLLAWPRVPLWCQVAALSLLGAVIELIQAASWINRDGEFGDWVAETLALLAVVVILGVGRLRHDLAGSRGFRSWWSRAESNR